MRTGAGVLCIILGTLLSIDSFRILAPSSSNSRSSKSSSSSRSRSSGSGSDVKMMMDTGMAPDQLAAQLSHWVQYTQQGLADANNGVLEIKNLTPICPGWGEPGWGPFCFLNGNPVFQAFDYFQMFIQNSIVTFHDVIHDKVGIENAYGPSIIFFTLTIRAILFPLNYLQLASSQKSLQLNPKLNEIREKYADNKELQGQMTALLYQETEVNPLAGCLPALVQIPVFIALYRSFLALATKGTIDEPFLWFPNLQGPTFGARTTDWITGAWAGSTPPLGWHDTVAYLTVPVLLFVAQSVSLKILTPPTDDPAMKKTQAILKYLPLMLSYFSLSVPAGLGLYWIINNSLSTVTTASIKAYLKANPESMAFDIDLEAIAAKEYGFNPIWGYSNEAQMMAEARLNERPLRIAKIPDDFKYDEASISIAPLPVASIDTLVV